LFRIKKKLFLQNCILLQEFSMVTRTIKRKHELNFYINQKKIL